MSDVASKRVQSAAPVFHTQATVSHLPRLYVLAKTICCVPVIVTDAVNVQTFYSIEFEGFSSCWFLNFQTFLINSVLDVSCTETQNWEFFSIVYLKCDKS